jgi:hypothetical protein
VPHVQFWESNKLPDSAKAVLVDLAIALVHTFTRQPNGTTDIDVAVIRDGKNLKGRVLGFVLGTIGRRVLEKAFENSVKALEAARPFPKTGKIAIFTIFTKSTGSFPPFFSCIFRSLRMARLLHL